MYHVEVSRRRCSIELHNTDISQVNCLEKRQTHNYVVMCYDVNQEATLFDIFCRSSPVMTPWLDAIQLSHCGCTSLPSDVNYKNRYADV